MGESTGTELLGDVVKGRDLGRCLNLVQWLTVRAVSDTVAVDGNGVVAVGKSYIYVGVGVVVVWQVPVAR